MPGGSEGFKMNMMRFEKAEFSKIPRHPVSFLQTNHLMPIEKGTPHPSLQLLLDDVGREGAEKAIAVPRAHVEAREGLVHGQGGPTLYRDRDPLQNCEAEMPLNLTTHADVGHPINNVLRGLGVFT
jgi:hypothetical protein